MQTAIVVMSAGIACLSPAMWLLLWRHTVVPGSQQRRAVCGRLVICGYTTLNFYDAPATLSATLGVGSWPWWTLSVAVQSAVVWYVTPAIRRHFMMSGAICQQIVAAERPSVHIQLKDATCDQALLEIARAFGVAVTLDAIAGVQLVTVFTRVTPQDRMYSRTLVCQYA